MLKKITLLLLILSGSTLINAQIGPQGIYIGADTISYTNPKEYLMIDNPQLEGLTSLERNAIRLIAGISKNDKITIPSDRTSEALENLWRTNYFDEITIDFKQTGPNEGFLIYRFQEKLRLATKDKQGNPVPMFAKGSVKKSDIDDLKTKAKLIQGKILTDQMRGYAENVIKDFFVEKGYANCSVSTTVLPDTAMKGYARLKFDVQKGKKVKIEDVIIAGNKEIPDWKLRKKLKETKRLRWYNPFNSGKYLEENYDADKLGMLDKYLAKGYRDARIVSDSVVKVSDNRVKIYINIDEGAKYTFGNITWIGNTKYTSGRLDTLLAIKKGDLFNQELLDKRLNMNPDGIDISSLYMDDGYLFFQLNPTETNVNENNQIDIEIAMYEGVQATIGKVTVVGNTKTNDRVIYREIRTRPGQLFRRSDIQRTLRELGQLGYFDPEKLGVQPVPNPKDGTVDIQYTVEEKASDQIQLSGGWGGGRIVGTLAVTFNNFSAKNIFNRKAWTPLPSGDGQKLSISANSSGTFYQSYNISFAEPWFGGKKPIYLGGSVYHNVQNYTAGGGKRYERIDGKRVVVENANFLTSTGASINFSKRLKWPDDYFNLNISQDFSHYNVHNFSLFSFQNGYANNVKTTVSLNRNSLQGNPIFPTGGSNITFTGVYTPPYSLFNKKDYSTITEQEKYKWLEYQKYKFTAQWYMQLTNKKDKEGKPARNLILRSSIGFGMLTYYNRQVGITPFERFYMGGSGLTGFSVDGREIIALRGYNDQSIDGINGKGASNICKYTMELRYPISLNPQATIFALGFAEAGNAWSNFKDVKPFNVKRSAGVGIRIFLPMFGLLGLDYGWGFDKLDNPLKGSVPGKGQFHFTIGAQIGEL